jgi:hypothetical protein
MAKVRLVGPENVQFTAECSQQAAILQAYCEAKRKVGESTNGPLSVTNQKYTELCRIGEYRTASGAREQAQDDFDRYAEGRKGTLYWRVVPEIAFMPRREKYGYYMRLLISDKPVIANAE